MKRKITDQIKVGNVIIGGNADVSIQSMTNTDTKDISATIGQIHKLEEAGCEIIRVAVPDMDSVRALKGIKDNISIPLVADIHFDYRLAVESAKYVDKIRINPGNIGDKVPEVVKAAKDNSIPIRVGVNLGSLEKDIEKEFGLTAKAMVESALRNIKILEDLDFYDTIVSLKANDVVRTVKANKLFSNVSSYPLHLGVTESGSKFSGTINSSIGIGSLLVEGIGDTIRVSLSADPVEEVKAGWQILKALQLRKRGISITSCPTCARANFDVIKATKELEERTACLKTPLHIAIMGCAVNGPGEAKEADLGVVGGNTISLYRKGEVIKQIEKTDIIDEVMRLIEDEKP